MFIQKIFRENAILKTTAASNCQTMLPKPGSRYAETGQGMRKISIKVKMIVSDFF
jgi:hypothetical protein